MNKVQASGTKISEGVLGYLLLNCANLSEDKHDMIKATCSVLSYKIVKTQLEKIGIKSSKAGKFTAVSDAGNSKVKVERCFYEDPHSHNYSGNSSDDDLNGERVYFSSKRSNFDNQQFNKGCKLNPTDRVRFASVYTIGLWIARMHQILSKIASRVKVVDIIVATTESHYD